jgi:hypothetical protein
VRPLSLLPAPCIALLFRACVLTLGTLALWAAADPLHFQLLVCCYPDRGRLLSALTPCCFDRCAGEQQPPLSPRSRERRALNRSKSTMTAAPVPPMQASGKKAAKRAPPPLWAQVLPFRSSLCARVRVRASWLTRVSLRAESLVGGVCSLRLARVRA